MSVLLLQIGISRTDIERVLVVDDVLQLVNGRRIGDRTVGKLYLLIACEVICESSIGEVA